MVWLKGAKRHDVCKRAQNIRTRHEWFTCKYLWYHMWWSATQSNCIINVEFLHNYCHDCNLGLTTKVMAWKGVG
jgi:hypothetical protein